MNAHQFTDKLHANHYADLLFNCDYINAAAAAASVYARIEATVHILDRVHLWDATSVRPMIPGSVWTGPDRAGLTATIDRSANYGRVVIIDVSERRFGLDVRGRALSLYALYAST